MNQESLIQELIKDGYLKTPAIIEAFRAIDRKDFIPEELKDQAYINEALPIGNKQTISQPLVVAFMLEFLELKPGEKVLEIGTGSGWQTALMAHLGATIISIERIKELRDFAKQNLEKYGLLEASAESASNLRKSASILLMLGDGSKGYIKEAPYDKVIAAAAADALPSAWKEQLKIGGRLVAPVEHSIVVLDKVAKNKFETREYFGFSFVPLVRS